MSLGWYGAEGDQNESDNFVLAVKTDLDVQGIQPTSLAVACMGPYIPRFTHLRSSTYLKLSVEKRSNSNILAQPPASSCPHDLTTTKHTKVQLTSSRKSPEALTTEYEVRRHQWSRAEKVESLELGKMRFCGGKI